MTLLSIVGALLVLTVLVFVHELGHFYAGKRLGFRIDEFAIGMGTVRMKVYPIPSASMRSRYGSA